MNIMRAVIAFTTLVFLSSCSSKPTTTASTVAAPAPAVTLSPSVVAHNARVTYEQSVRPRSSNPSVVRAVTVECLPEAITNDQKGCLSRCPGAYLSITPSNPTTTVGTPVTLNFLWNGSTKGDHVVNSGGEVYWDDASTNNIYRITPIQQSQYQFSHPYNQSGDYDVFARFAAEYQYNGCNYRCTQCAEMVVRVQ